MNTSLHISFIDIIILCGAFTGFLISTVFILKGRGNKAILYQGMLVLFLSLATTEEFLNNTGYITRVLAISNFAEPFNFTFAPLFYLAMRYSLWPDRKQGDWHHFVPFVVWVFYMVFYFVQPNELKYNSYLDSKHPDWPFLIVPMIINEDPVGIRNFVNELTAFHFALYIILSVREIQVYLKESVYGFFKSNDSKIATVRSSLYHFVFITAIFIFVKLYFGRDLGDMFISAYIAFMIVSITLQALLKSNYFKEVHSLLEIPSYKYKKSSLSGEKTSELALKIKHVFEEQQYYTKNTASLEKLAKQLNESTHHVSQAINQELQMSFFELLAHYRIEKAKNLLEQNEMKETIEEIAYQVGYNSKSAFNKAFKNKTGKTPSEFRKLNRL